MLAENFFILKVLLSFIVGGIWVTLATVISEKLGTKIGGIIANLPSIVLISLLFIGINQTPEVAALAAQSVPAGMIIVNIFNFLFIISAKKYGQYYALLLAITSWFLLSISLAIAGYNNMVISIIIYLVVTVFLLSILESKFRIQSVEKGIKQKYSIVELLFRACFAGGIIATSVVLSALLGPIWGGLFSTFPAVLISTFLLLSRSQGIEFTIATGKTMLLASINMIIYAMAVNITYPIYGLAIGTIFSYISAALFVLLLYPLIKKVS